MIAQNEEYPSSPIYPKSKVRHHRHQHHHHRRHRNMTTKRATSYGHPHQQRRPPDVEEALSSMLWTPYERASNTDTSSEDEDEQLNRQLRKSKSQYDYDYTSIPTIPPSPTPTPPPPPSLMLPATNIVAYIPTPTPTCVALPPGVATSNCLVSGATQYYAAEDLCDASVTTPLVPFSNLMLSANSGHLTATVGATADEIMVATCTATTTSATIVAVAVDDAHNNCYPNESTLAATSSSFAASLENHKNRFSYPSYGRIPGLTKWWSSNSNSNSNCSNATATATSQPSSSAGGGGGATPSSSACDAKEPPSYESLYSKQQRRRRHATTPRHGKHLNIFKPVLETLKANVSTITQGRFAGISSSSSRQDNSRVNANTSNNSNSNSNSNRNIHGNSNSNNININISRSNNPCTSNSCNTGDTGTHLVHSFTDDFLTEHCTIIHRQQHVAATNVDNEHIINNNNTINNNNVSCSITTIDESTEPAVQQHQQQQQHSDDDDDEEEHTEHTLIHRPSQLLGEHDHNTIATNTISQQTEEEQEQETENKQNNNFILCQQQRPHYQTHSNEAYEQSIEYDKMNTITSLQMNPPAPPHATMFREPTRELMYSVYCHSSNPMLRGLPYETTSSPISLTRSFEVNTTYGSLTGIASHRNTDTFKTSLEATASNCGNTTTTYNLTPNKCLAELERLYAEFRASESLREKRLRETQGEDVRETTGQRSSENSETNANMRLNVPATTTNNPTNSTASDAAMATSAEVVKAIDTAKMNPSTSSVFLTTTNSVTALTNPCQRTPSLTIQVNQNPGNTNNSNNNNNNNNNNVAEHHENASQIVLNQAIVNTTATTTTSAATTTKNGVSVINCNYVNNTNNNNHNNNNNKSITNLCDIATNTNLNISHVNNANVNPKNLNTNINSICSSDNSPPKNITNSSDTDPSGNSSHSYHHHHSSVPKVLNIENININNNNNNNHENTHGGQQNCPNTSVNVIQVNGNTAPIATPLSPSRTFTSTQCQTDDIASVQMRSPRSLPPHLNPATLNNNRDQRRRERRERRHLHHTASMMVAPTHAHHPVRHSHVDRHSMPAPPLPPILHPPHMHPGMAQNPHNVAMLRPMLPDILHNHFPPPYSALPSQPPMGLSGSMPNHPNGSPMPQFAHACPPPPPPGVTLLGPAPPPPPAGTTLLTSVISTVPIPGATPMVSDGRFTLPLPIIRRSPSERSGKGCCGQWFAGPPLRALIAVVALGGVACALGGAALGATGLAGPPSSHFTAALLMIGVGVVLVTVSGAAWRMTAPGGPPCLGLGSSVDLGRCGRRPCSRGGGAPQGLLYPEFQHRPPPPSYQASMQEYRLRLLLLDRDRQNGVVRGSSPPPTYRSHAGSLLRAPLTTTIRGAGGIGATGRAESSIGGSEYSFPPSYRSRNTTPGTISSERSIETEPSGRLLANEDIPEPLSVEQLSEYNTLQQRTMQARLSSSPNAATTTATTHTTSMAHTTGSGHNKAHSEEKRHSRQLDKSCIISKRNSSSDKKDDLVTIVTITPQSADNVADIVESQNSTNLDMAQSGSREQIEILAHL